MTINVKPGWKSGTKITFQREGDQAPNKIPADIVFIIRDKPHHHFRREGSDLRHVCKITLREVRRTYLLVPASLVYRDSVTRFLFSSFFINLLLLVPLKKAAV